MGIVLYLLSSPKSPFTPGNSILGVSEVHPVWIVSTVNDALPLLVTAGTALHASVPLHRAR